MVFFLGLQSINVTTGHKTLAFITSFCIGAANLFILKTMSQETSLATNIALLCGGPIGIVASMSAQPYLVKGLCRLKSINRKNLHIHKS